LNKFRKKNLFSPEENTFSTVGKMIMIYMKMDYDIYENEL